MKISRASVNQLNLPLARPYYLSGGRLKFELLNSTFVNSFSRWNKSIDLNVDIAIIDLHPVGF